MKVCLLEDNHLLSQSICKKFKRNDIECIVFSSIASYHFIEADVYIFDIMLEAKSYNLIQEIRGKTDKPFVIYTSYSNIEYLKITYDRWADVSIWKITSPNLLVLKIQWIHRMYQRLKNWDKLT